MYDSTNVIQTTLPGNTTFSSLVDSSLPDNVVRVYTGAPGVSLPTDAPSGATGTNGFTLLQLGITQFYQEQGAVWMRSVTSVGAWHKLLPPLNIYADPAFPYGLTGLTPDYQPLITDESLDFFTLPGIYVGGASINSSVGLLPTGASGQGFSLEVKAFPTVVNGTSHQGCVQTYIDNAGEWKRATSSTGALSAWVRTITF